MCLVHQQQVFCQFRLSVNQAEMKTAEVEQTEVEQAEAEYMTVEPEEQALFDG